MDDARYNLNASAFPEGIYVAGPMRGYRHFNFEAFYAAAAYLRGLMIAVKSPAEHDVELGLDAIALDLKGDDEEIVDFDPKGFIMWDLHAVADTSGIYLLHDWSSSKGACLELRLAQFLRKDIRLERDGDFRDWSDSDMALRNKA